MTITTTATITKLIESDGMPADFAEDRWTIPEGMDHPWDNLADLLDSIDGFESAEWIGGDAGLLVGHFSDGEEVRETFRRAR